MNNAKIIILALAIAGLLYYVWQSGPKIMTVADLGSDRQSNVVPINGQTAENNRLNFTGGEQRKFSRPKRDLFGLLYPAPAPVKVKPPPEVIKPVAPVVEIVKPPPPPIPVRSTTRRMPAFQVLGFLERNAQITAFVSLQGEIYLVKQDQLFADEYRVAELNHEMIRITRAEGAGEVSLQLTESSGSSGPSGLPRNAVPGTATQPVMPPGHPPFNGAN